VIRAAAALDPPVPRLLSAMGERPAGEAPTLVLGGGCAAGALDHSLREAPDARLLVLSALGAHPDARAPRLKALWDLEEQARGAGRPVLTLRLAPIVGPQSPLWLRLRSRPRLPEPEHTLLNPVIESDVVETLQRALEGRAAWEGWYEVAGAEAHTLEELATLAATTPPLPAEAGAWEPPHAELREHRLAECGPWAAHFGITPGDVSTQAASWR
jgi:uncharacterized protein YbjT (DUF2867 family)